MRNVISTTKIMLRGHLAVFLWSYVFQFLMCVSTVFSAFLSSVLVDAYTREPAQSRPLRGVDRRMDQRRARIRIPLRPPRLDRLLDLDEHGRRRHRRLRPPRLARPGLEPHQPRDAGPHVQAPAQPALLLLQASEARRLDPDLHDGRRHDAQIPDHAIVDGPLRPVDERFLHDRPLPDFLEGSP